MPVPFRVEAGDEMRAAVSALAARLTDAVSAPSALDAGLG